MLARPPVPSTVNTVMFPPTRPQLSQPATQSFSNQYRLPNVPSNLQGTYPHQIQTPHLPPNLANNQSVSSQMPPSYAPILPGHHQQLNPQSSSMPNETMQSPHIQSRPATSSSNADSTPSVQPYPSYPSAHIYPNQHQSPNAASNIQGNQQIHQVQSSALPPPNFQNNQSYSHSLPPSHPPTLPGHGSMYDSYASSGLPSASMTSNQPPGSTNNFNPQFENVAPHLSNQSVYNGPTKPSFPPHNQQLSATGHSLSAHYPNLPGPSTMPNSQSNTLNTYPGQLPPNGPVQPTMPSSRIDPNAIPNVIQVLEQSQEKIQEPFLTNIPGSLPPLVGTDFICQDQGSCNPRFMRSTVYSIPQSADMVKQSHIPIAVSVSPLADLRSNEHEPPLTNFGEVGPVRCHRCKAYMCSFMQFIDGGKRFTCCFCDAATDVPSQYFQHLDHSGRRMDCYQRPELCLGAYEILATKQYCKDEKWPEPPAFIFMIDVSYNSVRSGLVEHICNILKTDLLDYLPKDKDAAQSTVRIGFATFDKQIHFYNIKNTLGQPQMMVVSDLEDVFVPLLEGFLCLPQESRGVINSLLDQIPKTFANTHETEVILVPVIQAGIQALKAANCSGKLYIFSTALPTAAASGKLSNRDDKKMLGTDKEKVLLSPATDLYTKLGEECVQSGCAVDLFAFPNTYIDLATIGEVCRVSGGQIYKFNHFSVESEGERLENELKRNFQRMTAFDALMRIRTSTGIRPIDFIGNFFMTNTTEMMFGTIDSDKTVSVELKHDDKLSTENSAYIQVALLYTSISGQRRLRILSLALTVTSSYTTLYPSCDLDTIINYITKVAVRSISMSTPKSIRDNIISQAANMLACYRKNCAQSTTAGQLILPDTLKLLPMYVSSLIKSDALSGVHTLTTDERSWLIHRLMSLNVKGTSAYLYPRIYSLHDLEENNIPPPMVRCLYERLSDSGAYVVENGFVMYIWLGSQIDPTFVQCLFGVQATANIQPENCCINELDNPISQNVRKLLSIIRNERNSHMKFFVIRQRDSLEPFFKNYLVEDKGFAGGASYVDFLYHLHREIRNILQ